MNGLVLLTLTTMIGVSAAVAQTVNPAIAQSRRAYDDCVYGSVLAQLNQLPVEQRRGADMSMLAEQGFVACSTEGQVMATILSGSVSSPNAVNVALLGVKAQIKRNLATIAADPVGYLNKR
jgi:hypothetical protein